MDIVCITDIVKKPTDFVLASLKVISRIQSFIILTINKTIVENNKMYI